ncbi:MAG: hypothetical protein MUC50_22920, partial [Myxococcota bacterium]|nr:hypothetical protein [Myxococcota bacterium]
MFRKVVRHVAVFSAAWLALSVLMTGCMCAVHGHATAETSPGVISVPPPPDRTEIRPEPPSSIHVWISGYWEYNVSQESWVWQGGSWQVPPEDGSNWRPPQYEDRGDGTWIFIVGYWERPKPEGDDQKDHDDKVDPGDNKDKDDKYGPDGKKHHDDKCDKYGPDGKKHHDDKCDKCDKCDKYGPDGKKDKDDKYGPDGKKDKDDKYGPDGKKDKDDKYGPDG